MADPPLAPRSPESPGGLDGLLPLVYDELRRMAHHRMRHERGGHTLSTTGLVHEAYLKLAGQTRAEWRDRGHFLAVAAQAMRRVLVDPGPERGGPRNRPRRRKHAGPRRPAAARRSPAAGRLKGRPAPMHPRH